MILLIIFVLPLGADVEAKGNINIKVEGKQIIFPDVQPVIKEGRILVPIRAIAEAMNISVNWDPKNKVARFVQKRNRYTKLVIPIQSSYLQLIDGTESLVIGIDKPAQIMNQRTMVPLRVIGEAFDYHVHWEASTETASYINDGQAKIGTQTFGSYDIEGSILQVNQKELQVFWQINHERITNDLAPLALDVNVSKVARTKSQDMHDLQYFSHTSPTYGSPFEMMESFDISYRAAGENIAAGYLSAQEVMTGWMNSDGHRKNILSPQFTHVGVGYMNGNQGYFHYWTQMFIRK